MLYWDGCKARTLVRDCAVTPWETKKLNIAGKSMLKESESKRG